MSEVEQEIRAILRKKRWLRDPGRWVDYARTHGFRAVKAVKVPVCPDCSGAPFRTWGQHVYYSTPIRLLECIDCGLVWADAHIDSDIIHGHFERAYKDEEYFRVLRGPIFHHLVDVIDTLCRRGARIVDIGGARGDLMAQVIARRPDVRVVINDISETATSYAARNFGFATLTGDVKALAVPEHQYDLVVLSDVLYYEPNLRILWAELSRLVCQGGAVVIRVPNKHVAIRLGQLWYRFTHTKARQAMQDRIRFFQPEHIFILRQRYLRSRLTRMGFTVNALPSPPLGDSHPAIGSVLFNLAMAVNRLSRHALVPTPAMLLVGRRLTCR